LVLNALTEISRNRAAGASPPRGVATIVDGALFRLQRLRVRSTPSTHMYPAARAQSLVVDVVIIVVVGVVEAGAP